MAHLESFHAVDFAKVSDGEEAKDGVEAKEIEKTESACVCPLKCAEHPLARGLEDG
jgi:hypothetical protein